MLFWGASWPIANVLSAYINEHEFIVYRYALATMTMAPVLWWMKLSFKISLRDLMVVCVVALLLIFYTKFYFLSTKHGAPGLAGAVVTTLMPILVYVLMLFSKQKKPQTRDWLALLLGALGVLTTMNIWHFQLSEILNPINLYLVLAAACWALMSITTTQIKQAHPAVLSFYIYLITTVVDAAFFFEPTNGSIFSMDKTFWIGFLIVTIGSTTFATTVYFLGIQKLGTKQASVFTFSVPFFAVGLSAMILSEPWQWTTIVGALMTIIALIILNKIDVGFYNSKT